MGAAAATSKDSTCTINAVPTLAPSMRARPAERSRVPLAAKAVAMSAVAVLLWSTAVTSRPAKQARARPLSPRPIRSRSSGPKPRARPVVTMCVPHRSSATAPAMCKRVSVPVMAPVRIGSRPQ